MRNIIKKVLKEEYGRDYRIESLYDVIKDELLEIPLDDFKMLMSSPIGGVENFMLPHTKHEEGHTKGLSLNPEGKISVQGPHGMLAMAITPKLKEMGIIHSLKNENDIKILDKIATLFYNDIKGQLSNDSDMFGRGLYDIETPDAD